MYKITIILLSLLVSGCSYIDPFVELYEANKLGQDGKYSEAISHYKSAIKGFAKVSDYESFEYDARCSYALMLNDYSKAGNSDYILIAQNNFDLVIAYLRKGNEIIMCSEGVAVSSRANTIQQQASYSNNEEEYYKFLESAYYSYQDAIKPLEKSKEYLSLAYTYYNLAETSEWYGDIPEAIKWIKKAIDINKQQGFSDNLAEDEKYLSQLELKQKSDLTK